MSSVLGYEFIFDHDMPPLPEIYYGDGAASWDRAGDSPVDWEALASVGYVRRIEDTLPQWLAWRFRQASGSGCYHSPRAHGHDWPEDMPIEDRLWWEHEAAAVRRAVARGGFKPREEKAA